jgi:hypothetical protein
VYYVKTGVLLVEWLDKILQSLFLCWTMLRYTLAIAIVFTFGAVLCADESVQVAPGASVPIPAGTEFVFEKDVLPVLQAKCIRCHGEKVQKAELDLSRQSGINKGSSSGQVVVAGKPDDSLLLEVLHDGLMPPPKNGEPLTPAEVEILQQWIQTGAHFARPNSVSEPAVTEREISQIMLLRCAVCHNGSLQEGGLDLRSRGAMLKGGKSGPAINLEKPADSLLLKKIHAGEMPPLRRLASVSIKVIEKAEVELVAKWIELGAPSAPPRTAADERDGDSEVTAEDRQFWSFQPPRPQAVPTVKSQDRVRNPIDAFILEKLEAAGLPLSPDVDRRTLIRRAYFDLIGLPPTPAEVEAFLNDADPNAYENLIERLLASERYGERWGRYWLDLAGYSDSDGVNDDDPLRPYAYRYRDYVIRSLNKDKPYDRFLLEQIAGDELADYEHAPVLTDELYENLVATGFLRMAPDGTYNGLTNFVPDRQQVIASELEVLTSSVMGLTVKCARCHSHKFDPLPHRDYYRLAAIFKGAYDENDWLRPSKAGTEFALRGLKYFLPGEKEAWQAEQARLKELIEKAQAVFETRQRELITIQLGKNLSQLPQVLQEDVRAAALESKDKRTEIQKYLISKFDKILQIDIEELQKIDADFKMFARSAFKQVKALKEQQSSNEPFIHALWDRGQPTPTYILRRGSYLTPGKEVEPGVPAVLTDGKTPFAIEPPWPGAKPTGRRLAFARWLVNPDNPLTARVMVNRIWKHHFTNGIVKSLDNFGRVGQRPTHPELLDWLAREFVQHGWSMKSMHRLIMTSSTYRQSSQVSAQQAQLDLDNRLLSRFPLRRLEAEALRDALLFVSGSLDQTAFGPAERVESREDGLVSSIGTSKGWRRSIYVLQRRTQSSTILEDFDLPQMAPNCVERTVATVAPQALHLLNNKMVHTWARGMAERIVQDFGSDRDAQIKGAYQLALGRQPDAVELEVTVKSFEELRNKWQVQIQQAAALSAATDKSAPPAAAAAAKLTTEEQIVRKSLTNLCHALMNSAEFIYVD